MNTTPVPAFLSTIVATAVTASLLLPGAAQSQTCTPDFDLVASPNAESHNNLSAVAVIADDDVWAVGTSFAQEFTAPYHALIEHWDGGRWTIVPAPTPPVFSQLLDVSGVATDDVWAVGSNIPRSGFVPSQPLIEHWDGSQWTVVPSPDPNPNGSTWLNAVGALASDDVWAVGESGPAAVFMHWDGNAWTVVPPPDDAGRRFAVVPIATDDVWASGESRFDDTRIFTHSDGTNWTTVPNPPLGDGTVDLFGISGVATDDIWSVGDARFSQCDDTCMDFEFAEVEHWDGSGWQRVAGPSTTAGFSGLRNLTAQAAQRIC